MHYFITGATGFVGGHIAEACLERGQQVTALVRPGSDSAFLDKLGVQVRRGELTDANALRPLLSEVDVVVHCAAKVGDWGPVSDYRPVNVEGLRALLEASKGQALSRFIHLSSLGVYAARDHFGTDETEPLPATHRDGYSQSKAEADRLAQQYYRDYGVPVVVLRPGFIYGPRDRTVMPRIIATLREGTGRFPGGGQQALNSVFVGNLVRAVFLAVERDAAVGQVYNVTDGERVSKRRFIEAVADALNLPRPTRTPPFWLAWTATWISEWLAKLRGATEAPAFNFTRLKFMALNLDFSIDKAKRELGYQPRTSFAEAIKETMAWYREQI